jgi:SAM-dependent methyltransferase
MAKKKSKITIAGLQKIWKQVPADYYEVATLKNPIQKIWHGRRWKVLKSLLSPKVNRVLDIGCASGHFTEKIKKYLPGAKVVGVDVYQPFLGFFRELNPKLLCVCADAHKLPFEDECFDVVILSEVLDHVVDPSLVLAEIRRVLRSGGRLIVSLDELSLSFRVMWFFWIRMNPGKVWKGAHLHHFDSQSFEQLLISSGFSIEERRVGFSGMIVFYKAHK